MAKSSRRLIRVGSILMLFAIATTLMWVRSYHRGDYIVLVKDKGSFDGSHLSFARGYCRIARGGWLGPGGERVFSLPIESVGYESVIDGAQYIPLPPIIAAAGALSLLAFHRANRSARNRGFSVHTDEPEVRNRGRRHPAKEARKR